MRWFRKQPKEKLVYEGIALLLLKQTHDVVKDSSQTLKEQLDVSEQSKLPKIEAELFYFYVFALDYWLASSHIGTQEKRDTIRQEFHDHLSNVLSLHTLEERLAAYAQIVNETKDDKAKFLGFGMKLQEFCGVHDLTFLVLAPHLFTQALETISIIKSEILKH